MYWKDGYKEDQDGHYVIVYKYFEITPTCDLVIKMVCTHSEADFVSWYNESRHL